MSAHISTDEWQHTTLGELGDYLNGRGFKKAEWRESGRPIVRIQNLTGSSNTYNYFDGDADERHIARPGDLLVSWAATLGAYIWRGPEAVVNQHIFKVKSKIDTRFHKYLLDYKLAELMQHTHGSGMVHITRGKFDSLPVFIPSSICEQQRIVEILDDQFSCIDAASRQLSTSEARMASLRRAEMDRLFACQEQKIQLSEVVSHISAGKSLGSATRPAGIDEWGIIKVSAMTWGRFDAAENKAIPVGFADSRFEIKPGDLLVSRANTADYVGASVLVGDVRPQLLLSDKSLRLETRPGINREWLWRALQAPSARAQITSMATGTKDSMRNISQASLLKILIPDVSSSAQIEALGRLSSIDDAHSPLRAAIARAESRSVALKRALLSAAFSGQLTGKTSDLDRIDDLALV